MTTQDPRDQAGGPARPDGAGAAGAADAAPDPAPGAGREPGQPDLPDDRPDDRPAWLNGTASDHATTPEPLAGDEAERPAWWAAMSRSSGEHGEQAPRSWDPDWSSGAAGTGSDAPTRQLGEPYGAPAYGPPPLPPTETGTARPQGGVFRWLSLGLAGLLLVAAGVIVGQVLDRPSPSPAAAQTGVPPSTAGPGPVRGTAEEPVAAVAEALTPSVVQLEAQQGGLGSGVIYDSNGFILTAAHVVNDASEVTVRLADGTRLQGRVLGADAGTDVGVVKVDRDNLPAATLATGVRLRVGQLAVAIGSPFGLEETVTSGVVSAVNRTLPNDDQSSRTVIQTDAAINPGNSGGALADRQGRVIGINSAIRTSGVGGGNVGVGFAIPVDIAARVAGQIVKGEPVRQTYLGVAGNNSPNDAGAVVTRVVNGSPAASVGVRVGDRITKFNGVPIEGMDDLVAQVRSASPGTRVTLELVRDGKTVQVTPQLAENPE
jgi:putative serine protease PepD